MRWPPPAVRSALAPGDDAPKTVTPARALPHLLALVPLSTSLVDFTYEYSAIVRHSDVAASGRVPVGREEEAEKDAEQL